MSNISGKLKLIQLVSHVMMITGKDGNPVKCVVLPIQANHFVEGEKGLYMDFSGLEIKNRKSDSKDTHIIKQSIPKPIYDSWTDEQKKAVKILGNLIVWGGFKEPDPVEFEVTDSELTPKEDDLPF